MGQYEDSYQEINYFGDSLSEGFLTEHDYQNSEFFDANVNQIENDLAPDVLAEIYQLEDKRSGPKHVSQIPKKKIVPPPKQLPNSAQEKRQNEVDPDKVAEIEEENKNVQNFNFENDLRKIKIPVPFTDLMKNLATEI